AVFDPRTAVPAATASLASTPAPTAAALRDAGLGRNAADGREALGRADGLVRRSGAAVHAQLRRRSHTVLVRTDDRQRRRPWIVRWREARLGGRSSNRRRIGDRGRNIGKSSLAALRRRGFAVIRREYGLIRGGRPAPRPLRLVGGRGRPLRGRRGRWLLGIRCCR